MSITGKRQLLLGAAVAAGVVWTIFALTTGVGAQLFLAPGVAAVDAAVSMRLFHRDPLPDPATFGQLMLAIGLRDGFKPLAFAIAFWVLVAPCMLWALVCGYHLLKARRSIN